MLQQKIRKDLTWPWSPLLGIDWHGMKFKYEPLGHLVTRLPHNFTMQVLRERY